MKMTVVAQTEMTGELLNGCNFYVIEMFPYPQFVMDENGELKSFDTYKKRWRKREIASEGGLLFYSFITKKVGLDKTTWPLFQP